MSDEQSTELVVASAAPINLFGSMNPAETVARAAEYASALADVIQKRNLYKRIGQKNHVLVEGWTMLGSMIGVYPVCCWTREIENGWEARVEARTRNGEVVGAAESMCTRSEQFGRGKDDYAIRSMAQTRATSKALRMPLGFIVVLAGYEACTAEEVPDSAGGHQRPGDAQQYSNGSDAPPKEKTPLQTERSAFFAKLNELGKAHHEDTAVAVKQPNHYHDIISRCLARTVTDGKTLTLEEWQTCRNRLQPAFAEWLAADPFADDVQSDLGLTVPATDRTLEAIGR